MTEETTDSELLPLILRAVLACPLEDPPWFGPSAIIDDKGIVLTNYVDANHKFHLGVAICHIDDLVANLRRMCDAMNAEDAQAALLFRQVRDWIRSDARPTSEQAEDRVPIEYRRP
jgi:hypothetical protein